MNVRTARGTSFAIATPHSIGTEEGAAALRAGGNALDAVVAAAAALTVVYPHNCSVGGDVIALVATPDGTLVTVNGSGAAPAAASAEKLRAEHTTMPLSGVETVTVPGAVAAWEAILSLGGRRSLPQALEAAISAADEGVPIARSLARAIEDQHLELAADEGLAQVFLDNGSSRVEGSLLLQPALAQSLRAIAAEGPAALYGGKVGAALVERLRSLGSCMTLDDLAAHQTKVERPIAASFGDLEVLTAAPNSQGFVLLETLAAIAALGTTLDRLGPGAGVLARLFELAARDRDNYLADPRFADLPLARLLSHAHAVELAKEASAFGTHPPLAPRATGDTVAVVAIDNQGYAASVIQSIFYSFGSLILDPATGIICHNRGAYFSLDPRSPNGIEGGKRPAHTLMPVIVRKGGRIVAVNGTMGGSAQPQIHTQLLLAAWAGATPMEAVESPRWTVGSLESDGSGGRVVAERSVPPSAIEGIEAAGFKVDLIADLDEAVGHAQVIAVDGSGAFVAASDPRADGSAAAG